MKSMKTDTRQRKSKGLKDFLGTDPKNPLFHPKRLYLKTKAYLNFYEQLYQWLCNGVPGAYIHGHARRGKTFASRMILSEMKTRSNENIPVLRMAMHRRDQKTIKMVFYRLAKSNKLAFSERATCDRLSSHVKEYLCDCAATNDESRVVLLVDEAQRLSIEQVEAFSEIYDDLEENKISISIFLIGNTAESEPLLNKIEDGRHEAIRGRFFSQRHVFEGFKTKSDIKFALSQYDKVHYPRHSKTSLTANILPREVKDGFKFATLSDPIWTCYEEHFKLPLKLRDWPAQHFFSTSTRLLIDFLYQHGPDNLSQNIIKSYIETSGLVNNLVSIK